MNAAAEQIVEALLDFEAKPRAIREDHEGKPVIYRDKVVKDGIIICPHCNAEIHEKGTFSDDNLETTRHRECNGIIRFAEPSEEVQAAVERGWGLRFDKESGKWEPVDRPESASKGEDPDDQDDNFDEYA